MPREPVLGILMLDNSFRRFPGDGGNPATWRRPVIYRKVPAATTERVTTLGSAELLPPFLAAGQALVADGATAITTMCGFLAIYQRELAAHLPVPVAASALAQVALVERLLPPGRRAGVITFNAAGLGRLHLEGVGARADTPIEGLAPDGVFRRALLEGAADDSFAGREADAVEAARRLVTRRPDVAAIVLECTNLVPHAAAIAAATRLPVYDFMTLVDWFLAGLAPRTWPQDA